MVTNYATSNCQKSLEASVHPDAEEYLCGRCRRRKAAGKSTFNVHRTMVPSEAKSFRSSDGPAEKPPFSNREYWPSTAFRKDYESALVAFERMEDYEAIVAASEDLRRRNEESLRALEPHVIRFAAGLEDGLEEWERHLLAVGQP